MKKWLSFCLCIVLSACSAAVEPVSGLQEAETGSRPAVEGREEAPVQEPEKEQNWVRETAVNVLEELGLGGMEDIDIIYTAYRYIIENTYFADPVGLDIWRYASGQEQLPTYEENRAISPLLFGIGSCEDFAAALSVLLQQAGLEARYVAGFTISVDGDYVDHAWTVVRWQGDWYHLDPQLEQNIIRDGVITYRYFMKNDDELVTNHKWGENLIDFWPGITEADAELIRKQYTPPLCEGEFAPPPREPIALPMRPNTDEVLARINKIKEESGKGELEPIDMNVHPPRLVSSYEFPPENNSIFQYGRSFLSGEAAALYDAIYVAASSWDLDDIPVPAGLSALGAQRVAGYFLQDNPTYYWLSPTVREEEDGKSRFLELDIAGGLSGEEIRRRQGELEKVAAGLAQDAPGDAAYALRVHDLLASTVVYDAGAPENDNPYGALFGDGAICDGYSRSFQYLLQAQGMRCIYIRGTGPTGVTHSWNALELEGNWYYVDVTWDVNKLARQNVFHDFFLVSDGEMDRQHAWDATQYPTLPRSATDALDYYRAAGYAVFADEPGSAVEKLAAAYLNQLSGKELGEEMALVFLEVKVFGSEEQYGFIKDQFVKNLFLILRTMRSEIESRELPINIMTTDSVSCNFNDTMQILILYPQACRV